MPQNLQTLPPSKDEFVSLIGESLLSRQDEIMAAFAASSAAVGVRYVVIDDLLPAHIAAMIEDAFPDGHAMRLMDSFRERKFTSKAFDRFDPILSDVTFAFQDRRIVEIVERVTGIEGQMPDPLLYAGGLSVMGKGHFLGPHIDNSHDSSRRPIAPSTSFIMSHRTGTRPMAAICSYGIVISVRNLRFIRVSTGWCLWKRHPGPGIQSTTCRSMAYANVYRITISRSLHRLVRTIST